jgi:regulator of protease activity HflC (stomatin/prohibitin superfamily)
MITIISIVVAFAIAGLYTLSKFSVNKRLESKDLWIGTSILFIGIIISLIMPFTVERVDAGHVGIKVNLTGDSRGISSFEYKTGWVVINSWVSKLYEFPTYQQHVDYPEQTVITKGGFQTTIKPAFNYSLKPGEIGNMFQNLRLDIREIEQRWLLNAIVSTVNDVANLWTIDDIFNHRGKFEADIIAEANKRVSKWFNISQLRTNIVPPEALRQSIEAKTKAIQEVQVAENQKFVAIAEGDRKIAQARADSAAQVIAAAGEAEAIRRKQLSLNATYIEYIKIQKWNGVLPTVQSAGSGLMIQLPGK